MSCVLAHCSASLLRLCNSHDAGYLPYLRHRIYNVLIRCVRMNPSILQRYGEPIKWEVHCSCLMDLQPSTRLVTAIGDAATFSQQETTMSKQWLCYTVCTRQNDKSAACVSHTDEAHRRHRSIAISTSSVNKLSVSLFHGRKALILRK